MRRRLEQGRLAYYRQAATAEHWDEVWEARISPDYYAAAQDGHIGLPELERLWREYLPRTGRILEAGCGPGHVVLALRARGYDAEGVEYAIATVQRALSILPDLPIRWGDVTALDVDDATYAAYLSFGVVEHRREGPEPFFREAHRILKPDGLAFFSVPHLHPLRRWRASLSRASVGDLAFYQYAFAPAEFDKLLRAAGFSVLDSATYDTLKGVGDELPWLKRLAQRPPTKRIIKRVLALPWVRHLGHMRMVVARKVSRP
jgi:SAM-dependent methyltransferase